MSATGEDGRSEPLVRCVDHLTVRVGDNYEQAFSFFTETLGLPVAWPIAERYPNGPVRFRSGGIAAGSINIEIFSAASNPPPDAQFYSVAFEPVGPVEYTIDELNRRNIEHSPPLAIPQDVFGEVGKLWTLVFLGGLFNGDLSALPPLRDGLSGSSILDDRFDRAFRRGMAFLCVYNNTVYDVEEQRRRLRTALDERAGGRLGLIDTQEVVIGASDLATAREDWRRVMSPLPEPEVGVWSPLQGPAIRLVSAAEDGLIAITWKVASLDQAATFLSERGMLGRSSGTSLEIDPATSHRLRIRLVGS